MLKGRKRREMKDGIVEAMRMIAMEMRRVRGENVRGRLTGIYCSTEVS